MYGGHEREISKEEYEAVMSGERSPYSFFDDAAVMGYGLIAHKPFERDGKYILPFDMADSCD